MGRRDASTYERQFKKVDFNAYKTKYPVSYMDEIQEKLKNDAGYYAADIFTSDDLLLKKLDDPKVWFDLMSKRWHDLFQKRSGTQGKAKVEDLRELRDKWAHSRPISLEDALSGIDAATNLLINFQCENHLGDLQKIHSELVKLAAGDVSEAGFLIQSASNSAPGIEQADAAHFLNGDTQLIEPVRETGDLHLEVIESGGILRNLKVPVHVGRVIVGRGNAAHVSLNDSRVSRIHLMLMQNSEPGLMLTDLRSANGTLLDGKRLQPNQPIQWNIGQSITVGSTWIVLRRGA